MWAKYSPTLHRVSTLSSSPNSNSGLRQLVVEQVAKKLFPFPPKRAQREHCALGYETVEVLLGDCNLRRKIRFHSAGNALQNAAGTIMNNGAAGDA